MKKIISIIVMLALVITTGMTPFLSHAMPHHAVKSLQTVSAEEAGDCHHKASVKHDMAQDKVSGAECCGKDICKCSANACHGLVKFLGDSKYSVLSLSITKIRFSYASQPADSAFPERAQRPPRA